MGIDLSRLRETETRLSFARGTQKPLGRLFRLACLLAWIGLACEEVSKSGCIRPIEWYGIAWIARFSMTPKSNHEPSQTGLKTLHGLDVACQGMLYAFRYSVRIIVQML